MINRRLILSTGNNNKISEIKDILVDLPVEVYSKAELGLKNLEVDEDGISDHLERSAEKYF